MPMFDELGIPLAGPAGQGDPIVSDTEIAFNGSSSCGHVRRELGITWPEDGARGVCMAYSKRNGQDSDLGGQWFAGRSLLSRTCDGNCSHESFNLPLSEKEDFGADSDDVGIFGFCKTAFKPYDLAVQICLIMASHHLGNAISVSSDGTMEHWADAIFICDRLFGYGWNFRLAEA